jgi:hypothetical protein
MATTKDGRWEYGVGEYQKKISDYLGIQAPAPSTSVGGAIANFLIPALKVVKSLTYSVISSITIPVFYIWIKGPDEVKRIAEWPFAKSSRDSFFPSFVVSMEGLGVNDLQRVSHLNQLQATAGTPSMENLGKWFATEQYMLKYNEVTNQVIHKAGAAATSAVIPLLVATVAAVAVIVLFLRKS